MEHTSILFISSVRIPPIMAEFGVEEARTKLKELADRSLMGEKIMITTDRGNAVLICEEDWDSLVEAMCILTVPEIVRMAKSGVAGC